VNTGPHPLAAALAQRLRETEGVSILELGTGSGRNASALRELGFHVHSIADGADYSEFRSENAPFAAALSTHALLHGTPRDVELAVERISACLLPRAPFYATFASKSDSRYGKGTLVARDTYAPESGPERGVAHAYFDEAGLRKMLDPHFDIETFEEVQVEAIVGRWAHAERPRGSVHWFVKAVRR